MKTLKLSVLTAVAITNCWTVTYVAKEVVDHLISVGHLLFAGIVTFTGAGLIVFGLWVYTRIAESIRTARPA